MSVDEVVACPQSQRCSEPILRIDGVSIFLSRQGCLTILTRASRSRRSRYYRHCIRAAYRGRGAGSETCAKTPRGACEIRNAIEFRPTRCAIARSMDTDVR